MDPTDYVEIDKKEIAHYYGDTTRILFLIGGVIILATLPFYKGLLPIGTSALMIFVVLLALGAAIMNPFQRWIVYVDTAVAAIAMMLFEYTAITWYGIDDLLLSVIRQVLAIIFLFSLYYSGKTLRAMLLHQIGRK